MNPTRMLFFFCIIRNPFFYSNPYFFITRALKKKNPYVVWFALNFISCVTVVHFSQYRWSHWIKKKDSTSLRLWFVYIQQKNYVYTINYRYSFFTCFTNPRTADFSKRNINTAIFVMLEITHKLIMIFFVELAPDWRDFRTGSLEIEKLWYISITTNKNLPSNSFPYMIIWANCCFAGSKIYYSNFYITDLTCENFFC